MRALHAVDEVKTLYWSRATIMLAWRFRARNPTFSAFRVLNRRASFTVAINGDALFRGVHALSGMHTCSSNFSQRSWITSARFGNAWPGGKDSLSAARKRGKPYSTVKCSSCNGSSLARRPWRLRFLPDRLALAGERHIVIGPQQDQMIDNLRRDIERAELDFQIARLAGTASQEQSDADFPGLTILTHPMGD